MRILITGASGFIAGHLIPALGRDGHEVLALRHRRGSTGNVEGGVRWIDSLDAVPAATAVDAIVNLAGAPILGPPWTAKRRQVLLDSRIGTTRRLLTWLAAREQRPSVLVNGSAVGWYGTRGEEPLDESAAPRDDQFQSQLCQAWESAANEATALGLRVVCLRFGIVLGGDGGALPLLARPVRLGVGAILGTGRQGSPWIHVDDVVGLIRLALREGSLSGAVNAVAPERTTHADLQHALARVLNRPLPLRVPAFVLRATLGEMAQLLVDGQHVVPARALAAGYRFEHPSLQPALRAALVRH